MDHRTVGCDACGRGLSPREAYVRLETARTSRPRNSPLNPPHCTQCNAVEDDPNGSFVCPNPAASGSARHSYGRGPSYTGGDTIDLCIPCFQERGVAIALSIIPQPIAREEDD